MAPIIMNVEESSLEAAFSGDARPRAHVSLPANTFSTAPPTIGSFVGDAITKALRSDPAENPVFLLEPLYPSKEIRLKTNGHIAQVLFETLRVPAIFFALRDSLAGKPDLWAGINAICQKLEDDEWLTCHEYLQYWESTYASHHTAMALEHIRATLVKMGLLVVNTY